jgi:hypothetical protein
LAFGVFSFLCAVQCGPFSGVSPCRCPASHLGLDLFFWWWPLLRPCIATSCLREATHAVLCGWLRPITVVFWRYLYSSCLFAPRAERAHPARLWAPGTCRQVRSSGVRRASRARAVSRSRQTHPLMRAIRGWPRGAAVSDATR